jgi:RNA polymerase sigma factor (sigma-70 family)
VLVPRRDPLARPEKVIPLIYAYVAYRLGDGPDADDATSETIERALRYRESYDPAKGEPMAWLIGIARNCISDIVGQRDTVVDADAGTREFSPEDVEAEAGRRLTLRDAVARLDERERELIALRYGADLTARQIAAVLGLRTNAVEVALHRALGRLRAELDREPSGELRPSTSRAVRF